MNTTSVRQERTSATRGEVEQLRKRSRPSVTLGSHASAAAAAAVVAPYSRHFIPVRRHDRSRTKFLESYGHGRKHRVSCRATSAGAISKTRLSRGKKCVILFSRISAQTISGREITHILAILFPSKMMHVPYGASWNNREKEEAHHTRNQDTGM